MRTFIKFIISISVAVILLCGNAFAGFSAKYDRIPISAREFVATYDANTYNLSALGWKNEYDSYNNAAISFDAGYDIWLSLDYDGTDSIKEISIEKGTATSTNFEYLCAVVAETLHIIAPKSTNDQINTALASLFIFGITEGEFDDLGYSFYTIGENNEIAIVYIVNDKHRKFYIFQGEL